MNKERGINTWDVLSLLHLEGMPPYLDPKGDNWQIGSVQKLLSSIVNKTRHPITGPPETKGASIMDGVQVETEDKKTLTFDNIGDLLTNSISKKDESMSQRCK